MRHEKWRAFWLAFTITLAAMAPILLATYVITGMEMQPAASSKSDVVIQEAGAQNRLTALVVLVDDPPAMVLVRVDAQQKVFDMKVLPAQSVVKNGQQTLTLAESYTAAGPARAAALLSETLDIPIDRYLAATPAAWAEAVSDIGTARVGLSGAMTPEKLSLAGISGEIREWTPNAAHAFLHLLDTQTDRYIPVTAASARAALWQGWARQKLDKLPSELTAGLRRKSGALLTNLSATDLLTLGQTLEFLANDGVEPHAQVLPGVWNSAAQRYEFTEDTLASLQAFASASAASGASSGSSVP